MKQPLVLTVKTKLIIMMYYRHEKQGLATVVQEFLRAQNLMYILLNTSSWSAKTVELVAYTH
jgi:quinol-cytochrome oxidoreductase complex cytochrome b subunit